jgi:DNA-binding transcriptional regulator WhiA
MYLDPYLLGIFLSEGHITGNHGKIYQWGVTQTEGVIRDKIENLMVKRGYKEPSGGPSKHIEVYNSSEARKMKQMFGKYSWQKRLPYDFIYYKDQDLAKFLSGFIDGDGSVVDCRNDQAGHIISIETTSLVLAQQLCFIFDKFNIKHRISLASVKELTRHQSYVIVAYPSIEHKDIFKDSIKAKNIVWTKRVVRNDRDSLINYMKPVFFTDDFVYDLETESHTLTVNGM